MNTRKQVFLMSLLLMTMLVLVGIYGAWYPSREADATVHFAEQRSERGAILFARNCRLCHGDVGEGGALGGRLAAAPALDRADLQGFIDSKTTLAAAVNSRATELTVKNGAVFKNGQTINIDQENLTITGVDGNKLTVERAVEHSDAASHPADSAILVFDAATLKSKISLITNTITCGRVGTAMPAWNQSQGGPLSDEQIIQLMTVITENRWDLVKEEVDLEDKVATVLTELVSDTTTLIYVKDLSVFTKGDSIRLGDERISITEVQKFDKNAKDKSGYLYVVRGIHNTVPSSHDVDEVIYKFPETAAPAINAAACGQTAQAAVPPSPPELIEPFTGQTVEITAFGVVFDKKEITVSKAASAQVRVRLINKDAGVQHNIAFYPSSSNTTAPVSPNAIGTRFEGSSDGSAVDDTAFDIPAPGSYFFRCDVHPTTMTGTFTVTP